MLHPVPAPISAATTTAFCATVAAATPLAVRYQPLTGKPELECFSIVPEHVASNGGEQLNGWAIWEVPGVFIEAEFHAVWRNGAGELIDLTPRAIATERITFLPDPNRKYLGRQVDNVRKALVNDIDVTRYLRGASRTFHIKNAGDLANQHGTIELSTVAYLELRKVEKEMAKLYLRLCRRYGRPD